MLKRFVALWKQIPEQPNRKQRFYEFVGSRIKEDSKKQIPDQVVSAEFYALQDIVNGNVEKRYPLLSNSLMKAYLPSPETFRLLDKQGQEELEKKTSPLALLIGFITGKDKSRNV